MATDNLTLTLATLRGRAAALAEAKAAQDQAAATIAGLQASNAQQITAVVANLQGSDEVGYYSSVDQLLRRERFAGKRASLDHVHANPEASEKEAIKAWETAALAETGLSVLLQDPAALGALYRANLLAAGAVSDTTWEAQRAWILARTVDEAMGL
jgi:hypothetical protein